MRITITDVEKDDAHYHWKISFIESRDDGVEKPCVLIMPQDTLEWRAAEYNIDPTDFNTLIDICICEQYIPQTFYDSDASLWKAPNIETARNAYLAEIAKIKLQLRVSTRGKDSPTQIIRTQADHNGGRMAIKGMQTLLYRHDNGAQELAPEVYAVLSRFHENISFERGSANGNVYNPSGIAKA